MARDSILPIVTYAHPKEGRRSVQYTVDLTNLSAVVDLVATAMMGQISQICTLFFDNADNAFAVTIVMEGTLQRIVCPPNSQGYVRLLLPQKPRLGFSSAQACQFKINLLNWEVPEADIWTVGGGTTVVTVPVDHVFLTSAASPFAITPGAQQLRIRMYGGGGGGSGSGTTAPSTATAGGDTIFNGIHAAGGSAAGLGSINANPGAGGTGGAGAALLRSGGGPGGSGSVSGSAGTVFVAGGTGGSSALGGGGISNDNTTGSNAPANSGGGGGGAGSGNTNLASSGGGGGAGEYVEIIINNPVGPYAYTVGAKGVGGTAGTSGFAGGNGGEGILIITEIF